MARDTTITRSGFIIIPKDLSYPNWKIEVISDGTTRDVSDYIQLCPSCHRKFDMGKITLNQIKNGEL